MKVKCCACGLKGFHSYESSRVTEFWAGRFLYFSVPSKREFFSHFRCFGE